MYGNKENLNGHYRALESQYDYPVIVGQDFWLRLTGDALFFEKLIHTIAQTLAHVNSAQLLEDTIQKLSQDPEIITLSNLAKPL